MTVGATLTPQARIAAARAYAPPLVIVEPFDRRGARLRQVNAKAIAYAQRAGMSLEEVYPGAIAMLRALAPPPGTIEAARFARAVGLRVPDLYAVSGGAGGTSVGGERSRGRRRWAWIAAGLALGAATAGAGGALVGGAVGGLVGR